jgi:hypothetical protein
VPLPYSDGSRKNAAIASMRRILRDFCTSKFGLLEDFKAGQVIVQFERGRRRVQIRANVSAYAAAWLKQHRWSPRRGMSRTRYEERATRQAQCAVCAVLRDWIKAQLLAVELGMLTFEAAFLGQLLIGPRETVIDRITETRWLDLAAPEQVGHEAP